MDHQTTADLFTAARDALAALTVHLDTLPDTPELDGRAVEAGYRVEGAVAELNAAELWLTRAERY
ncbi:hypothetical protein [Corynebacterium variabile]|uniref:Uncharacterized protein n=1 Tax=Corynebacterium variabile TaxID=1727 RepID=A0A4Y4C8U7_9CORY|nr:hypothetical protein [Corynebacterium variabile]GEC87573.1 hypothetical protein CVA01_28870 [Corynebacterium variabile]